MPDLPPSPASSERKKQIVAAKNLLFGAGYFLVLSLPEGWGIVRSYLEPDVHSTVGRGGFVWVEAGQTDQIVFHRQRKISLDFMIRIKLGKHDRLDLKEIQVPSQGSGVAGGHQKRMPQFMYEDRTIPQVTEIDSVRLMGLCSRASLTIPNNTYNVEILWI